MLIDFRTLFPIYGIRPKGVLHIGANSGQEIPIYDELGIRKQIWIEGDPDIFLQLKQNINHNPQAVAFNYVIGDENKPITFHVANNGGQSSSVLELGTHKVQHPDVHYVRHFETTMHRIDSLDLDLTDVDFLNTDIQGADFLALKGMGELLRQFKCAAVETNKDEVYVGNGLLNEVEKYMGTFGFKKIKEFYYPGKTWGDTIFIK